MTLLPHAGGVCMHLYAVWSLNRGGGMGEIGLCGWIESSVV